MYQKDGNPGLILKYEVFEKNISDKSSRVYEETSVGDLDHDRGSNLGVTISGTKKEINGTFYFHICSPVIGSKIDL